MVLPDWAVSLILRAIPYLARAVWLSAFWTPLAIFGYLASRLVLCCLESLAGVTLPETFYDTASILATRGPWSVTWARDARFYAFSNPLSTKCMEALGTVMDLTDSRRTRLGPLWRFAVPPSRFELRRSARALRRVQGRIAQVEGRDAGAQVAPVPTLLYLCLKVICSHPTLGWPAFLTLDTAKVPAFCDAAARCHIGTIMCDRRRQSGPSVVCLSRRSVIAILDEFVAWSSVVEPLDASADFEDGGSRPSDRVACAESLMIALLQGRDIYKGWDVRCMEAWAAAVVTVGAVRWAALVPSLRLLPVLFDSSNTERMVSYQNWLDTRPKGARRLFFPLSGPPLLPADHFAFVVAECDS